MKTIITENINSLQFIELRDYMQNMLKDSMKALDAHNVEDIDWYKDCTMNDYFQMWEEIWNDDVLVGEGIDTIAHSFVLNDNTRTDFQNAFEQARNAAYEEVYEDAIREIKFIVKR